METEATCDNCKFWKPLRTADYEGKLVGMCRRLPPQITRLEIGNDFQTKFPRTEPDTWCGEHVSGVVPEDNDLEKLREWAAQ